MNNQLPKTFTATAFAAFLGLFACENSVSIYRGTFKDETYEVLSIETIGFSTNQIDYAIKLANQKWVRIDALTTDWGPPYSDDVYGSTRRVYSNRNHTPYSNERDNPQRHPSTMLYLSPGRFSKEAFERYADLLKSEWTTIDRQFSRDDYDRFPQIIGVVYGDRQDFVRIFRGRQNDKNYSVKVEPDGRIRYSPDGEWPNDEYSGLSEKVQMPGKLIYVATGKNAGLSLNQVQTYQDAAHKRIGDCFDLQEKSDSTSENAQ